VNEYHHSGHAVWDIKYHLVWITKYRYKVLRGEVAERARDLLREICAAREVRI
jgi:putative transposase